MRPPDQTPGVNPPQTREAIHQCAEELRAVLAEHGIELPSLGVDLTTYAGETPYPLVALGNCRLDTAHRLAEVLLEARRTGPTDARP